jgi:6-phospho-beta-glucosidase
VKLAIVGGGSTYTPELIDGFARLRDVLPVEELWLVDPDESRLELVGGVARRMFARTGHPGRIVGTTDLVAGVSDADAVLIQLRIGGQDARRGDETWPHEVHCIGQETTGPGGFAKALRTVPVILRVADAVRQHAKKDAWIVDFTNPVGIVTRALLDEGHHALGLCNSAIGFQRRFARHFGVQPERVELGHAGLNHLTWIRSVRVDGVERMPEMLSGPDAADLVKSTGCPLDLVRTLNALPSYYLQYYYDTDAVVARQRSGEHRAQEVLGIEQQLLRMYADPALDHKPELLEKRGGAYYSEAAAALVTSLLTGDGARHYVNLRNDGTITGLPDEAAVEVPATVDASGAHAEPVPDLPPETLGLVQAVTAYEVLAIRAAVTGDREVAARALIAHPLVRQWHLIPDLLADILDQNAELLPRFAPRSA